MLNPTKKYLSKIRLLKNTLLLIIFCCCSDTKRSDENLIEVNTVLSSEILIFKGSGKSYIYKFWTSNFEAEFVVHPRRLISYDKLKLEKLQANDTIKIYIKDRDTISLQNKSKRIEAYQIRKNGESFLRNR